MSSSLTISFLSVAASSSSGSYFLDSSVGAIYSDDYVFCSSDSGSWVFLISAIASSLSFFSASSEIGSSSVDAFSSA